MDTRAQRQMEKWNRALVELERGIEEAKRKGLDKANDVAFVALMELTKHFTLVRRKP